MAPPLPRRQMLGLLAAGFVSACSVPSGGRSKQAGPDVTSSTTAPLKPVPLPDDGPPFDRDHPMSGFVAFGDFGGGPAQGAVAAGMLQWSATATGSTRSSPPATTS